MGKGKVEWKEEKKDRERVWASSLFCTVASAFRHASFSAAHHCVFARLPAAAITRSIAMIRVNGEIRTSKAVRAPCRSAAHCSLHAGPRSIARKPRDSSRGRRLLSWERIQGNGPHRNAILPNASICIGALRGARRSIVAGPASSFCRPCIVGRRVIVLALAIVFPRAHVLVVFSRLGRWPIPVPSHTKWTVSQQN